MKIFHNVGKKTFFYIDSMNRKMNRLSVLHLVCRAGVPFLVALSEIYANPEIPNNFECW
jgi:hypothetical protein